VKPETQATPVQLGPLAHKETKVTLEILETPGTQAQQAERVRQAAPEIPGTLVIQVQQGFKEEPEILATPEQLAVEGQGLR
jgi:hypothetical protein